MKPSAQADHHWADRDVALPYDDETWDAIDTLADRPWFKRLWIWQEVRLAARAEMLCGYESVPWKCFCDGIFCLLYKPDGNLGPFERIVNIADSHYSTSLQTILDLTRHSQCTDQRDRIYGLLNLVPDYECVSSLKPDYSQSPRQVFQDVVLRYATQGRLDLLSCCEKLGDLAEKPTWVPDWSTPRECSMLFIVKASWLSKAEIQYAGDGTLNVTGLFSAEVDSVEEISLDLPADSSSDNNSRFVEAFQRLTKHIDISGLYAGGGDMIEAVCRTLCVNEVAETFLPPDHDFLELKKAKECILDVLRDPSALVHPYPQYQGQCDIAMSGRSFFTTREGYIGLAPKAVKQGDQICMLLGCNSPILLRSEGAGNHTVVGECYIQGLMDGEALLGPLPDHWQRVEITHDPEDGANYDGFINHETGETRIEDPRLGPLPSGWRVRKYKIMKSWNWYVNDDTREGYDDFRFDPRMTADALRERGVKLTQVTLI